jgi:hypothetical protein
MPVVGTSNLPVAPRNTPWNARAAKVRVFEACGGNVACIQRAFLWRSDGDPRSPEVWSLGFADVIDGRLHIVPKAVAACAGARGIGSLAVDESARGQIQARITTVYDRVRTRYEDWPASPFAAMTADASGTPIAGPIALEGIETGDGRFIENGALRWEDGPWPLVFDRAEMDHSGATIGTINTIERRKDGIIWGTGNLSETEDPETALLVLRAAELFSEGAVGVSVGLDSIPDDDVPGEDGVWRVSQARIRSVAIVDEAAFSPAKMALVAGVRNFKTQAKFFRNPGFGNGSTDPREANGDERLVWQEPEVDGEEAQFGCPLTLDEDTGYIYGHAALWYRCHVGHVGTCTRPPREPAAYKGYLLGDRTGEGIPTGPLVFRTGHAKLHLAEAAASAHYDNTGASPADVTIGPDAYGIWVSGQLRLDVTQADIEILRASALSGDWRPSRNGLRLIGILAVSGPGFRVARAMAASSALITVGPGCSICDDEGLTLEDRVTLLEAQLAQRSA